MSFLNPAVLPWLGLAVLPVALYLFRRQSRRVRVSTLLFFKSLAVEHQESAWRRRLKRWVSLLLSLLLVCGPVLALARLVLVPVGPQARSVVVVVDCSASMAAREGAGPTRLDAGRALVRSRLAGLPESVPVALVAAGSSPEMVVPKSTDRRALLRALDGLLVRPVADNGPAALAAASAIAALETPAEVWWVGDATPAATEPLAAGVVRRDFSVALAAPANAGITAFAVTRMPLLHSRYQAYVQVALNAGADGPRTAVLEPRVAGLPRARRELTLQPGAVQGLTFEVEAAQEQVLEVVLQLPGDVLEADNMAVARLPAPRPLVVAWFTPKPDPFTAFALRSLAVEGEVEVFTGGPSQWPPPRLPDVAVFDGWLPAPWPAEVPAVVINPPGSAGPVRARPLDPPVPREEVRAVGDEQHPVLFRLNPGRLALTQTAVLDATGVLQPLWLAGDQPVLLAGENAGQRVVVLGCVPALSEHLPLTTSYPLLLGNALYWCGEKAGAARAPQVRASGALIEGITSTLEWREVRGGQLTPPVSLPAPSAGVAVLDRLGLWRTGDGASEGSSALLSRRETDLGVSPPALPPAAGEAAVAAVAPPAPVREKPAAPDHRPLLPGLTGELTRWFLALVLAVLLVESWLYHRHAVS